MEPLRAVRRVAASASAVVAALTTSVYILVIRQQGDNGFWEVFPWVAIMVVGTSAASASALAASREVARSAAVLAAVVLGLIGVVALLSVGIGFVLAAVLAALAAVSHSSAERDSTAT